MPSNDSRTARPSARRAARTPRHSKRPRQHHLLRGAMLALVGLVAFAGTGGALAYSNLQGNIDSHDLDDILGNDRPAPAGATATPAPDDAMDGRAYNLLVIGSDVRDGANAAYGQFEGMRADTTILVHISADRTRVEAISIPRDLLVDVPSCPLPDGTHTGEMYAGYDDNGTRFNSAFAAGGATGDVAYAAACTILTVEQMTGVYIDDFVVVDFTGFKSMIDAVGGVEMCFDEPMVSRQAGLDLPAGCQVLDGENALAVARARKGVDDGSDLSRIDRQQELLTALVDQVLSKNLATDSAALFQFLQAATASLTTSERIGSIPNMAGLAYSLRGISVEDVNFITVPYNGAGNVVVQNADGDALWASIAADQPAVLPPDPEETEAPSEDSSAETDTGQTEGSGADTQG